MLQSSSFVLGLCREGGWGATDEGTPGPNIVKISEVPLLEKEQCKGAYNASLGENVICAGKKGIGACVVRLSFYLYLFFPSVLVRRKFDVSF